MSLRISPLTSELEPAWERFVESRPDAGIYHGLAWKRVTEEAFGHPARHLCALADGEIAAVLPLFEVGGLFGRRLVSVPMRDRGGPVGVSDQAVRAVLDAARALATERGARYLEIKGLEPFTPAQAGDTDWKLGSGWVTSRVDLAPGRDAVWSALNKKSLRWSIKKALKSGVSVEADASEGGMRTFHELFVRTRCRMGIPPFGWRLFEAIHRHLVVPGKAELLLARHEGRAIHGLISFYSKDQFVPAYAAPQRREGAKLYDNELILWTSMERAIEAGFRTYDFGADSERQENLLFFKRRWNAEPHPMAWQYYLPQGGDVPDFDSSGPRYAIARELFRRLPRFVTRPLGAWLTRQLS